MGLSPFLTMIWNWNGKFCTNLSRFTNSVSDPEALAGKEPPGVTSSEVGVVIERMKIVAAQGSDNITADFIRARCNKLHPHFATHVTPYHQKKKHETNGFRHPRLLCPKAVTEKIFVTTVRYTCWVYSASWLQRWSFCAYQKSCTKHN